MKLYKHRSSALVHLLYPSLVWKIPTREKHIYLTFDDGPTPGVTEKVLDLLKASDAKATFFCIGKNVKAHPTLYQKLIEGGHSIGNHSHQHLNGWKTKTEQYITDVEHATKYITSDLFRPPYGKILPGQIIRLKKKFRLIMWSALSGDFDAQLNIEKSLKELKRASQPGAIIVFHDSKKAANQLMKILPEYIDFLSSEGFKMKAI